MAIGVLGGCSGPWIKPSTQDSWKERYQQDKTYKLKKDIFIDRNRQLSKGNKAKIFFRFDSEWVKVYAYPHDQERINSVPILAIYILKDEVKQGQIGRQLEKELNEIFAPVK